MAFIESNSVGQIKQFIPYNDYSLKSSYFNIPTPYDNIYELKITNLAPAGLKLSTQTKVYVYDNELQINALSITNGSYRFQFWDPRIKEYVMVKFTLCVKIENSFGASSSDLETTATYNPINNSLEQLFTYRV